jgi:PncC family amidohydrolase
MLTDVSGASAVFKGGFVTYTNEMKEKLLGVNPDTIDRYTEVSEQTVKEMAAGARRALGTDFAVATTGYAGPTGGTAENPVGTVYVGLASKDGSTALRLSYSATKSRDYIRTAAARRALMELLKIIRE